MFCKNKVWYLEVYAYRNAICEDEMTSPADLANVNST
jgi:hypothetical protein